MRKRRPSVLTAVLVLILVGGLLYWWINALTNEDPLWFMRVFDKRADWITVYWEGKTHMFFPGDSQYEDIVNAFSDAVAHWAGYEGDVSLSEEQLDLYREQEHLLEVHYNEPVRVHTRHAFPEVRNFFVPLSGPQAEPRRVFVGLMDTPREGVLMLQAARFKALQDAVRQCVE
jgi:hypothetical protein